MRIKLLVKNTLVNFITQLVSVACGLVLPRLILVHFGSEVNGLTSSITQFLNYITLFEAGVGGVARAALYKPIANGDKNKISAIVLAIEKFFKKLAKIFIIYMIALATVFPYIIKSSYDYIYFFSLVIIIGISTFAQYYFGITYQILLQADQRRYISNYIQIITLVFNTLVATFLISVNQSIHVVKLASALIFVLRPIAFNIYVKKRYGLIKNIMPDYEAVSQRWAGLGHHIAFFLQSNTDIFILTIFTNPILVSVYSIYKYVIGSLSNLLNSFTNSLEAAFGSLLASNDSALLKKILSLSEFVTCVISTTAFTICSILIFPFILIYTNDVTDADYIQPLFAFFYILNEWTTTVRSPSNNVVLAAGHYKPTQKYAYLEVGINIIASMLLVNIWGLPGLVFATLCSTLFRSICFIQYMNKYIINVNLIKQYLRYLINFIVAAFIVFFCFAIIGIPKLSNYFEWIVCAVPCTILIGIVVLFVNCLCFKKDWENLLLYIGQMIRK